MGAAWLYLKLALNGAFTSTFISLLMNSLQILLGKEGINHFSWGACNFNVDKLFHISL